MAPQFEDAPANADESAVPERQFTVRPTDRSLFDVAVAVYGDGLLWSKIYLANRDVLDDPRAIEPGQTLVIPPEAPLTPEEATTLKEYSR